MGCTIACYNNVYWLRNLSWAAHVLRFAIFLSAIWKCPQNSSDAIWNISQLWLLSWCECRLEDWEAYLPLYINYNVRTKSTSLPCPSTNQFHNYFLWIFRKNNFWYSMRKFIPKQKKYVIYICCSRTFITFIFNHRTVQFRLITADSLFHFLLPDMLHSWYCIYIVIVSIVSISILHCIDMCCNKTIPGGECPWDANTIKDRNITLKQLISPQRIWHRTINGSSDISEQDTLTSLLIGKNGSAEAVASIISDSLPLKSQVWQVNSRLMTTEVLTHWAHGDFPFLGIDCKAYFSVRSCCASVFFYGTIVWLLLWQKSVDIPWSETLTPKR